MCGRMHGKIPRGPEPLALATQSQRGGTTAKKQLLLPLSQPREARESRRAGDCTTPRQTKAVPRRGHLARNCERPETAVSLCRQPLKHMQMSRSPHHSAGLIELAPSPTWLAPMPRSCQEAPGKPSAEADQCTHMPAELTPTPAASRRGTSGRTRAHTTPSRTRAHT